MNTFELKSIFKTIFKESNNVSFTLFKIMIPTLVVVGLLEYFGFTRFLGKLIGPFLALFGLPASAGLVWATTAFTNLYTGLAIFALQQEAWSQAQVTILSVLMLLAHNLPIETRIANKAGCRFAFNLALRLCGATLLGFLLNILFKSFDLLQGPALVKIPNFEDSSFLITLTELLQHIIFYQGISHWLATQLINCTEIYLIIIVLLSTLKLLRYVGIEKVISAILQPILKLLKINPAATSITIVGITLGLAYGGGLLIHEAESGKIDKDDIFASISFLSLSHSLLEDTLLVLLTGAHLGGVLIARIIFAFLMIYLIMRIKEKMSPEFINKFFVFSVTRANPTST